ncbi:hypothetical protein L6164_003028 [Bauhinia variegata]|uniref:Uncharacterized protein n=1 Tax=Bauhinia variegata TaxID=167791 RepID=A0ACB9PZ68_BAUVA|nr:hypothetical protein L6164_003028 [Bauhinia variegata]
MSFRDSYTKGHGPKKIYTKASAKSGKGSSDDDFAFQLIAGNGSFNIEGLKDFARKVNLQQCGSIYAVVAIMGPQSSGKSTLLNHLFGTNFKEMNHDNGRSQTTKGIWLARSPDIKPLTLVMDMEGTDGSERGEDEIAFEKQSALFALSVADVVLINMWCQDIGREHAANKPLLRIVFQQVMIQFSNRPRKMTLMFVVRDKTKSPENALEAKLREDIEEIWASILTPSRSKNLQLRDFFEVEVVFLPNYEEKEEEFKLKVKDLKQRFAHPTVPCGLADAGDKKRPASDFPKMAHNIWEDIMENKDLDIPADKVMVATVRSEEIRNKLYDSFQSNEDWCKLRKQALFGFVPDFGKIVNSVLNTYISKYDAEALYLDEDVTNEKREELLDQLSQLVEPVYQSMVKRLRLEHLKKFIEEFDKDSDKQNRFSTVADRIQCCLLEFDKACAAIRVDRAKWDTLKAKAKLQGDMNSYSRTKNEDKLAYKIRRLHEPKLKQELSDSVRYLLCEEIDSTWSKIRQHFKSVMDSTLSQLLHTLSEFHVDEENRKEKIEIIDKYAKLIVESKAREESGRVKIHMISKFVRHFKHGYNSWLIDMKNNEQIDRAASDALSTPLKLLAGLAAIHLEDDESDDNIQTILFSALLGSGDEKESKGLNSPNWEKVPPSRTLITPIECKELWEAFRVEAKDAVSNAPEMVQPVHQDMSNDLRQEYLNRFMEAYHKHSDKQNSFVSGSVNCYRILKPLARETCLNGAMENGMSRQCPIPIYVGPSSSKKSIQLEFPDISSTQHIKAEEAGYKDKTFKREDNGKRKITTSSVGLNDEKGNVMTDSKPAPPMHIPVSPFSPVSTCPKIKMTELKSSKMMSIPSEAPDMLSLQHIKVEERGGIEKTSKREEKGKMDKEKSSVGMAGSDAFFLPSSPGLELTTGSQSLRTYPHSFGYPFNTFSSPLNGALETDPNQSFWNQSVNFGNLIDRTLIFPFDVKRLKQLTPAERGHFMETTILQLISMMRIQNLECAHLFNRLSKIEKSGKVKAEMETKIDRTYDELEDVLPYKKLGSVQKLKSYVDVLEFGFWNGVKQVANQAKLQFPEFDIDKTKLDMFEDLHNGQKMEPRKAPEEEIDVKLI